MGYLRFLIDNKLFLLAGFLLTFSSSFGQTFFISIFSGVLRAEFSLSDGQWGGIYTLGTTASAITMIWAGALTDRFRVRNLAALVMLSLAVACVAMALVPNWAVLVLVIFALRLTGQGMMSQLGAVAMARWFVGARGRALSLASMGFAMGQAVLPVVFVALFAFADWRMLWLVAAASVLLLIPVLRGLLQHERTPQSMASETEVAGMEGRHWTRGQMLRSGLFWLMIPTLLGPPAWGTALFFQQVHLAEVKGWPLVSFVGLLPLFTLSSVISTFASGWAIDRFGVHRIVPLFMLPFGVAFLVLAQAQSIAVAGVGMVIFGMGQGMQSTVPTSFWAEFFGTRHLGAIKAVAAAIMVFGSAIGPGVTGLLIDYGVNFDRQMISIAAYFAVAAVLSTVGISRWQTGLLRA